MIRVLLVDDDPAIQRIYKDGLNRFGMHVDTVEDGVRALSSMHASPPDVVVLDLMMPRLPGQEVLKLMRSRPELASIPVVVLSNSYMEELTRHATASGSVTGILKIHCTPALLFQTIQTALKNRPPPIPPPVPGDSPRDRQPGQGTPGDRPGAEIHSDFPLPELAEFVEPGTVISPALSSALAQSVSPFAEAAHDKQVRANAREEFLGASSTHCASLRSLFLTFANASDETRMFRLQDLYRKVHFLTGTAGLAECHYIAQMTAVFEAMLYQLMDQPARITPSVLRTSAMAIDFIQMLFGRAAYDPGRAPLPDGRVLVVDDDPVVTRLVLWALKQAHLQAQSAADTGEAMRMLQSGRFDLILLDIGLPGMDGIQFCRVLRSLPAYKEIPVIHCTSHTDFQTRTQSALSGGDDFISKPVLPMELALKAVMHLIERAAGRPSGPPPEIAPDQQT